MLSHRPGMTDVENSPVIASASEAIQASAKQVWIASSLSLLAMSNSFRPRIRAAPAVGSLPPCGGELEKGVATRTAVAATPSLTLPRKGGGNAAVFAERITSPPSSSAC